MSRGTWWRWGGQLVLVAVVGWFVARRLAGHWAEFRALELELAWRLDLLALAVGCVIVTYAIQIESWRRVLAGWQQRLSYATAARIWWVANLGRYVPGKVWSLAGMVVLAQRVGVPAWVGGASAVALQAVGLATGVAVVTATLGPAVSPAALAAAAAVALGTLVVLSLEWTARLVGRLGGPAARFRPLPLRAVLTSGLLTQVSWLTYGAGFWLLARGLVPATGLGFPAAAGVFAFGYLAGLLAVFAPGGIVVREAVYVGLLAPTVGAAGAIAVAVASRLLLTALEAAAGFTALLLRDPMREDAGDQAGP